MKVVLFSIGGFVIRSYGVVVALAILLATGMACYLAKGSQYRELGMDMNSVQSENGINKFIRENTNINLFE